MRALGHLCNLPQSDVTTLVAGVGDVHERCQSVDF